MRRRHPPPRHPLPRLWLMTDSRMDDETGAYSVATSIRAPAQAGYDTARSKGIGTDRLWDVLERLPRGAGVVFRHYDLSAAKRRILLRRVTRVARRRGLVLVGAGGLATPWGGHNHRPTRGLYSRSAHSRREIVAAERAGADLVFVSPVFATRSHPGAQGLGRVRFGLLIRGARVPVIALGGMDARRGRMVARLGAYGWAGIDAWLEPRGSVAAKPRRRSSP